MQQRTQTVAIVALTPHAAHKSNHLAHRIADRVAHHNSNPEPDAQSCNLPDDLAHIIAHDFANSEPHNLSYALTHHDGSSTWGQPYLQA